jgi:hypothetical protein
MAGLLEKRARMIPATHRPGHSTAAAGDARGIITDPSELLAALGLGAGLLPAARQAAANVRRLRIHTRQPIVAP